MSIDDELEEILLRWEERRARGESVAIEELCRDHAGRLDEARRLIEALENLDGLISGSGEGTGSEADWPGDTRLPEDVSAGARYRAIRAHARGGLGEVFVAWDSELGREVALKLIRHPYDEQPERRERFLREAEITARLGHPGIVPVFGLGRTRDGRPCYTMRFIEGETLQQAIARFHAPEAPRRDAHARTMALRALISRLVAVCHTIAFAHDRGVIHRDLKPSNIMLGPYQETLVVDWGLAKLWRKSDLAAAPADDVEPEASDVDVPGDDEVADDALTRAGSTLGTPAYMSPEQASGLWDEVGPASDVYSLGATLHCVLTGRAPFADQSRVALLAKVRRGDFQAPRQVNRSTPRPLDAICVKAMALRPADRYPGVAALRADLDNWLADEPVKAWREPALVRLGRWVRRHKPLVAGSAALAATALVALSVSTLLLGREQARTQRALDDARANYRLARTTMADVQTSYGLSAAERHAPAEAALWFAEAAATAGEDIDPDRALASRIRAREWSKQAPIPVALLEYGSSATPDRRCTSRFDSLAFDGSGRFALVAMSRGWFRVHDVVRDESVPLPANPQTVSAAAWGGPAGDLLALGDPEGNVQLLRMPGAEVVEHFRASGEITSLEFSRDGGRLAVGGTGARVWDIAAKRYATPELGPPVRVVRLALSPPADRLATASVDGKVRVYDAGSSRTTPLFEVAPGPGPPARFPVSSPARPLFVDDGRGLVTVPSDRELAWHDSTTGAVLRNLPTRLHNVHNVLTSPNGRTIAVTGLGGVRAWDSSTGQLLGQFGEAGIEAAAFAPDGAWLIQSTGYFISEPVRLPGGDPGGWRLRQQDNASTIAVSPDGTHLALAQFNGQVSVWRLPEWAPVDRPLHFLSASARLAISHGGRFVMPIGRYTFGSPPSTRVRDLVTGREGPDLAVNGFVHGGAISPDGRRAVTLSSQAGGPAALTSRGSVTFWDWKEGRRVFEPIATPSEPVGAAYRPDGLRLAVLCRLGECVWVDPERGVLTAVSKSATMQHHPRWPAADLLRFSPDGRVVAHWGAGKTVLLDSETGAERRPALAWPQPGWNANPLDVAFSPDSRYMVVAGGNKSAIVFDLSTGRVAARPLAHPDWVFQAQFSPDGTMLLTGCRDANARVWDWRTAKLLAPPMLHQGEVQDAAFLEGTRWVLTKSSVGGMTTSPENSLQVWDWRTGRPITPPRRVSSTWGSQLRLTSGGTRAVLGGLLDQEIHVLNVSGWIDGKAPEFAPERIRETTELYSGEKIVGGSSAVHLTPGEWARNWRLYRSHGRSAPPAVLPARGGAR